MNPDIDRSRPTIALSGSGDRQPLLVVARWWVGMLVASLVLRLVAMWLVPLVPEEAYYWMYWQRPSMGYFDHPPMVGWVIGAGTAIFGDTEFGVRFWSCVLMLAASALMFWLGTRWFDRATGLLAALALQVLPAYYATGFIATMDGPMVFFWVLSLVGFTRALLDDRPSGWYVAGAGLGGAMLCKYTGVFLGLGGVLAVVGCRPWRRHLRSPHPYIASAMALAMFSPVVIWNARHDWISFRFQFLQRFQEDVDSLKTVAEFVGIQFMVATPVLLIALVWLLSRGARRPRRMFRPRLWFALCFSVPLLAVMAWKSASISTHINWTFPAYLSLIPAAAHISIAGARRARVRGGRRDGMREVAWTGVVCVGLVIAAMIHLLLFQRFTGIPAAFGPWRPAAAVAGAHAAALRSETGREPMVIAEGTVRLASMIAFYRVRLEGRPELVDNVTSAWMIWGRGLNYPLWHDWKAWIGTDCVCVGTSEEWIQSLDGSFDRVTILDDPDAAAAGLIIAIGHGYRGPIGSQDVANEPNGTPASVGPSEEARP